MTVEISNISNEESDETISNDSDMNNNNERYNLRKKKLGVNITEPIKKRPKYQTYVTSKNNGCMYCSTKICYGDGSIYEGGIKDNLHQGFGKLKCADYSYEGNWEDGKYNGTGTYICKSYKCVGYWKDNLKHGFCKIVMYDYQVTSPYHIKSFEGNFLNNQLSGRFYIEFYNNSIYKGEVKVEIINGIQIPIPDGEGEIEYSSGQKYEGYFKSGNFSGEGIYINENNEKFIGKFYKNVIREGKLLKENSEYEGSFKNFKMNGNGILLFNDGNKFEGKFINDDFHYGSHYDYPLSFKGHFRNYKLNGMGAAFHANFPRISFLGRFEDDNLVEPAKGQAKCSVCRVCSVVCEGCKIFTDSKCNICNEESPVILFGRCKHALSCWDCTKKLIISRYTKIFIDDDEATINIQDNSYYSGILVSASPDSNYNSDQSNDSMS